MLFLCTRRACLRLHLRHNSCSFRLSRHIRHVSTPARVPCRSYAVVADTGVQLCSQTGGSLRRCSATRLKSIRDAQLLQKLARGWKFRRPDADRGVLQELCSRAAGQQGVRAAGRQGSRALGRQGGRALGRQGVRAAGRQGVRAAGRQGGRAAGRQGSSAVLSREPPSPAARRSSRNRGSPDRRSPARSFRWYSPRRVCQPPRGCRLRPAARWRTAHPPPRARC